MNFWKKTKINSDEYEYLHKRITELSNLVSELSAKIATVQSDAANLRGQFNRKLSGLKANEEKTESESINNPIILPWNGNIGFNK